MSNEVLYVLMRNDLPSMNPGKMMAQAAHAANQFMDKVSEYHLSSDELLYSSFCNWKLQANRFGTTVVLNAVDALGIEDTFETLTMDYGHLPNSLGVDWNYVYDPTYPINVGNEEVSFLIPRREDTAPRVYNPKDRTVTIFRNVLTCGYIFGKKSEIEQYVQHLSLQP